MWILIYALRHGPLHVFVALLTLNSCVTALTRAITITREDALSADNFFRCRTAEANHTTTSIQLLVSGIARDLPRVEA